MRYTILLTADKVEYYQESCNQCYFLTKENIASPGVGRSEAASENVEADGEVMEMLHEPLGQFVTSLGVIRITSE